MGAYRHQILTTVNGAEEDILQDFARLIEGGSGAVSVVPEIQRVKFVKMFFNVALSSFATLTGYGSTVWAGRCSFKRL